MPFGLKNASATFQRYMDKSFEDIDCVFIYIDDILILSNDEISHKKDIETAFSTLNENNLKISATKSVFNETSLDFLGFHIRLDGIKPPISKIEELKSFPYPQDPNALYRFLRIVGFYRKLMPKFSKIVLLLSERMGLSPKGSFTLDESERQSFNSIIKELDDTFLLAHPEPNCTNYQLVTDSSNYAVGAALHQIVEGNPIPIGFFSKKLTQTRYTTFDRELFAAYLSVLHFLCLI